MYYLKKIFKMVFSIYLIGTISFLLLELIPGDPALAILGVESSPEDIAILRENLGLNKYISLAALLVDIFSGEKELFWEILVIHLNMESQFLI